ncbi:replication initiator protein A [Otoolea muris]|nr:replication initiator protein A [Otoolea muris]
MAGWTTTGGFLYFTPEEAMTMLDCGKDKPENKKS